MKIHVSSKFSHSETNFHTEFELNSTPQQISDNIEKVTNFAIQKLKEKCDNYFKIEFNTLAFIEVYYFINEKEIQIFKKEKV